MWIVLIIIGVIVIFSILGRLGGASPAAWVAGLRVVSAGSRLRPRPGLWRRARLRRRPRGGGGFMSGLFGGLLGGAAGSYVENRFENHNRGTTPTDVGGGGYTGGGSTDSGVSQGDFGSSDTGSSGGGDFGGGGSAVPISAAVATSVPPAAAISVAAAATPAPPAVATSNRPHLAGSLASRVQVLTPNSTAAREPARAAVRFHEHVFQNFDLPRRESQDTLPRSY